MGSGGGCLACLLEALDLHVECRQCWVLVRPKFPLQGRIGGADLEHHTHEIIDSNVLPVGLIDEGQEFVAELYN